MGSIGKKGYGLIGRNRYALLTVDTEALPHRALDEHVQRLVWGRHAAGTAGIREMCAIGNEVGAKHVFFVDFCGAFARLDEMREVARWLHRDGQDVQLHAHPEYLPTEFWRQHGLKDKPRYLNQFDNARAAFTLKYFSAILADITGEPVRAFRAGSFRWNADTLRALSSANIPLSFNNSMHASIVGQCVYSEPTNEPYVWSNGVVEVPMTERLFYPRIRRGLWRVTDFLVNHLKLRAKYPDFGNDWWRRLQFPVSAGNHPSLILGPFRSNSLLVLLMHSWSLLYWDENGHAEYRDDRRLEAYRKLLQRLTRDYDVITTRDFLDLLARGKIKPSHVVDLERAELRKNKPAQAAH
jgi:hypothetical protein